MRIRQYLLLPAFMAAFLGACSGDTTTPIERPVVAVTITSSTPSLTVGQKVTFIANVANDTTGALQGVTWSSSAPAVASVNPASGEVTAVIASTATITATSKFDPTKSASVTVTISVPIAMSFTISPATASISVGQTRQFLVAPATAVTFTSLNPSVATVNASTGVATAVAAGTAEIRATSTTDATKFASGALTVTAAAALSMPVLGSGLVPERYTAEVAAGNGFAYTTTWSLRNVNGVGNRGDVVKIWNVAGATPVLVDSLKIPGVGTTSDVQISPDGSLLVVSTEGLGTGSIAIYNRSNPAAPTLISRYQTTATSRGVHTVKLGVVNGKLYAFLNIDPPAALVILDLSNPASPQQVYNQTMGNPYIHDVFFRDGLLFAALWMDGMTIFDVGGGGRGGSPSNPVVISNIKTATGRIHNIWWVHDPVTGSKKFAILGEEGSSSGAIGSGTERASGDIHVIDISDLAAPRDVGIFSVANAGTHNFWVDEPSGVLYAAYYNGGVRAIDVRGDLGTCTAAQRSTAVGTPAGGACDLRLMGREMATALTSGHYVWGVQGVGTRLYASDMGKGLIVLDIASLKR